MGVKFGTEEGTFGPLLRAKFHLIMQTEAETHLVIVVLVVVVVVGVVVVVVCAGVNVCPPAICCCPRVTVLKCCSSSSSSSSSCSSSSSLYRCERVSFSDLLLSKSDGIEVSYNACGVIANLMSDGADAWTATAPSRYKVLDRMVLAVNSWPLSQKRNINYRSTIVAVYSLNFRVIYRAVNVAAASVLHLRRTVWA